MNEPDDKDIPVGQSNRGYDNKIESTDKPAVKITLEKINGILINYLKDTIKPTVVENGEIRIVPVLPGAGERWAQIRREGVIRDQSGKLQAPLILMRRLNVRPSKPMNPNNKYMYTALENRWNPRNTYDLFALKNNVRPSRAMQQVMIPDYVQLRYEVYLWTEYQAQMDELIQQIQIENFEYWGNRNNFKFRISIDEFPSETDLPPSQDRVVRTKFNMTVEAYLLPERVVQNGKLSQTTLKSYTAKKLVTMVETVVTQEELDEK